MSTYQRRPSAEPSVVVKNVGGRRVVSRSNPEISYAYGAPAVGGKTSARKRRSTQDKDATNSDGEEAGEGYGDDNAEASTSSVPDAQARYSALKKRKLQEAQQSKSPGKSGSSTKAARRTPRKGEQSVETMTRRSNNSSLGGLGSDELSSEARRQRLMSPGRSRSVFHGQLNSFYMDREVDSDEEIDANGGEDIVPSSILLGAQRQGFATGSSQAPEMDSIHSSDIYDSQSRDYSEMQKEADKLGGDSVSNGHNRRNGRKGEQKSGLNGIREESDAEQSAEERKHSQKTGVQAEAKKTFRSPPRPSIRKAPVPIVRHSVLKAPRISFSTLAFIGLVAALLYSVSQGLLPDLSAFSPVPSDGTLGDAALRRRVQLLEKRLGVAEKQVVDFERQVKSAKVLADSVAAAAKKLPAEVALQRDKKTGQFKLDGNTVEELKKVFVHKGDDRVAFQLFYKANEAALRKLTSNIVAEEASSGTILSRSQFTEMLAKEFDALKATMESNFNANVQDMQNEILSKVRSQQDMFERAGSWKKAQHSPSDGSEQGSLQTLIDDALEVFAADRLGERDFALYAAGARVIPSLTSPTYGLRAKTSSLFGWISGSPSRLERLGVEGQPPVIALVPDNTPGMCWAFAGSEGKLGISLARRIVPSKVTLEHTPASISHESGVSAPRDVTVWGIVERPDDEKRLTAYRQTQKGKDELDAFAPSPVPPSDRHILLSSFTYDTFGPRAVQSFPLSQEAETLQLPVAVIQVRIHSNHGKSEYTCLYRVRIHGREWTLEDNDSNRANDEA